MKIYFVKLHSVLLTALRKAKQYIETHENEIANELGKLLTDLWWHTSQLALECLGECEKANFDASAQAVIDQYMAVHGAPKTTKFLNEDVFGHLSHIVQRSNKGCTVMNKKLKFHRTLFLIWSSGVGHNIRVEFNWLR